MHGLVFLKISIYFPDVEPPRCLTMSLWQCRSPKGMHFGRWYVQTRNNNRKLSDSWAVPQVVDCFANIANDNLFKTSVSPAASKIWISFNIVSGNYLTSHFESLLSRILFLLIVASCEIVLDERWVCWFHVALNFDCWTPPIALIRARFLK